MKTKHLIYLTFSTIFIILTLPINAFYLADDYCLMILLKTNSFYEYLINGYLSRDGRLLSIAALFQSVCLVYLPVEFIILVWSLCLLLSGSLIYYILNEEFLFQINKHQKMLYIATITIGLWLGAYTHFSETVYWATGGVYVFDLFLGAIWTYLFLRFQRLGTSHVIVKNEIIGKFLFVIFSFLVGGLTQNLSMPLITLTAITIFYNSLNSNKKNMIFNTILFLALLSGLVFIMVAPGNFLRLKADTTADFVHLNLFVLIKNFCYVLAKFLIRSFVAIVVSIILGIAIAWQINPKSKFKLLNWNSFLPTSHIEFLTFLLNFKWLIIAVSSVLPFIAIPMFSARRTVIYFGYFITIFVIGFVIKSFQVDDLCNENQIATKKKKSNLLFFGIILSSLIFAIYNLQKGFVLKKEITKRENILKQGKGKTVHLKAISPKLNAHCFQFYDYDNTSEFVKSTQEQYFNVKIIVDK